MQHIPLFPRSIMAFVIVLGVLVFIHELGHYLAARLCGIRVETFSIGFGRALARWTDRHGTVWKLGWLPLGGYVKMHGQERPEDVPEEVRAAWVPGQTFHEKSVGRRSFAIAAGPLANFLLAAVLFAGLFAVVGRPTIPPVLGEVMADSPAARGGLRQGDRVLAIDGAPVQTFEDLRRIVAARPAQDIRVRLSRAGAELELPVLTGESSASDGQRTGMLGVRNGEAEYRRLDPISAVEAGIGQTWNVTVQTLAGLWGMIAGGKGTEDLGGPLRIAQISGQVAELGLASLVSLIAILSVNLALINLFPIPILDGGHLLFNAVEAITGRPVPPRAQEYGYRAGLAVLAALFVFATWNDLSHLGVVRWVASLIG